LLYFSHSDWLDQTSECARTLSTWNDGRVYDGLWLAGECHGKERCVGRMDKYTEANGFLGEKMEKGLYVWMERWRTIRVDGPYVLGRSDVWRPL